MVERGQMTEGIVTGGTTGEGTTATPDGNTTAMAEENTRLRRESERVIVTVTACETGMQELEIAHTTVTVDRTSGATLPMRAQVARMQVSSCCSRLLAT